MPLYSARTTTSSRDGGGSCCARISPRPASAIQNARASSAATRQFWGFFSARYNPARVDIPLGSWYPVKTIVLFAAIASVVARGWRDRHPFPRFGPANQITTARALIVALIAASIGEAPSATLAAVLVAASGAAVLLDGI